MDFNFDDPSGGGGMDLESDAELLAELAALENNQVFDRRGGGKVSLDSIDPSLARPKRTAPHPAAPPKKNPAKKELNPADLAAALAADNIRNVDESEDFEGDDMLHGELAALMGEEVDDNTPQAPPVPARSSAPSNDGGQVAHLRSLGDFYAKLHSEASSAGETAKANRYKRSVDKCRELEKKAARGVNIDEGDIPPTPPNFTSTAPSTVYRSAPPIPVRKDSSASTSSSTAPPPPIAKEDSPPAIPRRQLPSTPVVGDKKTRMKALLERRKDLYVKNAKEAVAASDKVAAKEYVATSKMFDEAIAALDTVDIDQLDESEIPPSPPPYKRPPPAPKTFMEHLEYRRGRFVSLADQYKAKNDERRMRMSQRQVGQYNEAIRDTKAGKPVDTSLLPSLPDMPQLPSQGPQSAPQKPKVTAAEINAKVAPPPAVGPFAPSETTQSRNANQLEFLLERQTQFKQAALHAKNAGNVELAKKYLIEAKGFDKMINASRGGLPVDISSAPIPPQALTSQAALKPRVETMTAAGAAAPSAVSSSSSTDRMEVLSTLEKVLIAQIHTAENNRLRFTRLADVGKVRQFEEWARSAKNDLVLIREVARQNLKVPAFHYEQRHVPSADLFPDLAEDVMEMTILGAVDVPLPSGYEAEHANLFVKYTFPYPSEGHQSGKTKTASGSRSPNWNEGAIVQIGSRKGRGQKLLRVLKRLPLKLEVYQKGGFLRSDKLVGVGEVKLDCLEGKAEHEESVPLKDGRKAIGGLVSVRVRVREPLGDTKMANRSEKWLVIDA